MGCLWAVLCAHAYVAAKPVLVNIDNRLPEVLSATIGANGVTLTVVFDEVVTGTSGFTLDPTGADVTLNYSSGSGSTTYIYTISRTILESPTETAVLDYSAGTVVDLAGNSPATIVDFAVTNNSTQMEEGGGEDYPILADPDAPWILVADEGTLDYTPTVVSGDELAFSATGYPTGLDSGDFNTSTGQITGTLSTPGKYRLVITASNALGSDSVYIDVIVYSSTGNITQASRDSSPVLATQHKLWTLTEDVTVDGFGFAVQAYNQTVDLNGHTLLYDNADQPWHNDLSSFETVDPMDADLADGWDFSDAADVVRVHKSTQGSLGSVYPPGEYILVATGGADTTQTILSDAITLPDEDYRYFANCVRRRSQLYSEFAITGYSWSGGSTTYTTSGSHDFAVGNFVNVAGIDPSGANGTFTITAVTSNTFTVEDADPGAYTSGGTCSVLATSVNVAIVDASDPETVLATSDESDGQGFGGGIVAGYCSFCTWNRTDDTTSVRLKITVQHTIAGRTSVIDLTTLTRSHDSAFWAAAAFTEGPPQVAAVGNSDGRYFALIDSAGGGSVIQGKRSNRSHCIEAEYGHSITFAGLFSDRLNCHINGYNTAAVHGFGTGGHHIENVAIEGDILDVPNRQHMIAALHYFDCSSNTLIRRNYFTGSGHIPIALGIQNGTVDHRVEENIFDQWHAKGTEGYAIGFGGYPVDSSVVRRNLIQMDNGRGILCDGFEGYHADGAIIGAADATDDNACNDWWGDPAAPSLPSVAVPGDGNFIFCRERYNREYLPDSGGLEAVGIRLRHSWGGFNNHENLRVIGNYVSAWTTKPTGEDWDDTHWSWNATGCRPTVANPSHGNASFIFRRNTFKAVCDEADPDIAGGANLSTAIAFALNEDETPDSAWEFYDNTLESNDVCFASADSDAFERGGGLLNTYRTHFIKSAEGSDLGFETIRMGAWVNADTNLGVFSPTYSGGATEAVSWADGTDAGTTVRFGSALTVTVEENDTTPISGASVVIDNDQAAEVFNDVTDANGEAVANLVRVTWTHNGSVPSSDAHSPFDIAADADGFQANSSLNFPLTGDDAETITLDAD